MSKELDKSNPLPATPELNTYFQAASEEVWREAAEKLLKGKSFDKTLRSDTVEGFTLEPIYHTATIVASTIQKEYPGLAPFTRGSKPQGNTRGWFTAQRVQYASVTEANSIILEGLRCGENAVCVSVAPGEENTSKAISVRNLSDLQLLFSEVDLSAVPLFCYCNGASASLTAGLSRLLAEIGSSANVLHGWVMNDAVTQLAVNGNLPIAIDRFLDDQVALYRISKAHFPRLKVLGADMRPWQHAGASAVQELGISLAIGAEYFRSVLSKEDHLDAAELLKDFQLVFAVGSDFFMEIAKLRAARLLWHHLVSSFDSKPIESGVSIHCETSTWNKTLYDPHVNMLRTTTEAMSAVMGGCDSLTILPFDEILNGGNSFSRRIARNTHHLLREESGFHQVVDPAGGAPYVESLTRQLAEAAWEEFKNIESSGGIFDSLFGGDIQKKITATAQKRFKRVSTAKSAFVGTNRYANAAERGRQEMPVSLNSDDLTFIDSDRTMTWLPPLNLSDEGAFEKMQDALAGRLYFS
ncbi:MAG: methylmalonyl-CoA mutase subunit beta, partial [Calditrichota bacterium]